VDVRGALIEVATTRGKESQPFREQRMAQGSLARGDRELASGVRNLSSTA
jgi:hypothetical protein